MTNNMCILNVVDKKSRKISFFGSLEFPYNDCFVLDGTKDSGKIEIQSFIGTSLEPNTICLIDIYDTFSSKNDIFIVKNDKVERYQNDNGYYYKHSIELCGAIDLLNVRDMPTLGFYQNRYTVEQVVKRILDKSTFEIPYSITWDNIDKTKNVDYLKTFENYSPYSAIREFLDGYNATIKVTGYTTKQTFIGTVLDSVNFTIYNKCGRSNVYNLNKDDLFNLEDEVKTFDKDSFGTSIISNAENVVSVKTKIFPTVGAIKPSSDEYLITPKNAFIRLPSNVFKVNNIIMNYPVYFTTSLVTIALGYVEPVVASIDNLISKIEEEAHNSFSDHNYGIVVAYFNEHRQEIIDFIMEVGKVNIGGNAQYNPVTKKLVGDNLLKLYNAYGAEVYWGVTDEETRHCCEYPDNAIYYRRGDNKIRGLDIFDRFHYDNNVGKANTIHFDSKEQDIYIEDENHNTILYISFGRSNVDVNFYDTSWNVEYIPMSDFKIKTDNDGETRDTNIYNQNGKLIDSNALSKLILSHSKEVRFDTITKYGMTNDINIKEKALGIVINENGIDYVINRVSCEYHLNDVGYVVYCEYTLSKNISTKSLMVNPNTNIRDYGIPQNNNVKRKQLYRDFYELSLTYDSSTDTMWYQTLDKIINLTNNYVKYQDHVGVMKIKFKEPYKVENISFDVVAPTFADLIAFCNGTPIDGIYPSIGKIVKVTSDESRRKIINDFYFYDGNELRPAQPDEIGIALMDLAHIFNSYQDMDDHKNDYYTSGIISYCVQTVGTSPTTFYFIQAMQFYAEIDLLDYDIRVRLTGNYYPVYKASENQDDTYYYQLDTTTFLLKKQIYEIIDFNDNNIIGYASQNMWSGFDIRRIFQNQIDKINSPVSYVDNIGEFESIEIAFCNSEQIINIYDEYVELEKARTGDSFDKSIYNYSVFIPSSIYEGDSYYDGVNTYYVYGATDVNDFKIVDSEYNKDALEVPVFEYSCQIDDSEEVLIGDEILSTEEDDIVYLYDVEAVESGEYVFTQYNLLNSVPPHIKEHNLAYQNKFEIDNGAVFEVTNSLIKIGVVRKFTYDLESGVISNDGSVNLTSLLDTVTSHKIDLSIVRYTLKKEYLKTYTIDIKGKFSDGVKSFTIPNDNEVIYRGSFKIHNQDTGDVAVVSYNNLPSTTPERYMTLNYRVGNTILTDKEVVATLTYQTIRYEKELLLVAKGVTYSNITDNKVKLYINHYKVE